MSLGFMVSNDGLHMYPKKVKVILEYSTPRNVIEVKSFHGIENFTRSSQEDSVGYVHQ
jgi:hypothetical protein